MRRSNGLGPTTLAMAAGASSQAPTTSSASKSVGRRIAGSSPQKTAAKTEASPSQTVGLQASRSKKALSSKAKVPPPGSMRNGNLETQMQGTTRRSRSVSPLPSKTPPRRRAADALAAADSGAGPSSVVASRSRRSSPQRSRQGSPMQRSSDSYAVDSRRTTSSQVPSVKQRNVRGGLSRARVAAGGSPSGVEITPTIATTEFGTFSDTSVFAKDLAIALTEIESRVVEGIPNLSLHDSPMQKLQGAEAMAFGSDRAFQSNPIRQRAAPASVTHEDRLIASEAFDRLFGGLELSADDPAQGNADMDAKRNLQPFVGLDSPPTLRCPPSARSHHVVANDICLLPGQFGLQSAMSLEDSQALCSDALRDEDSRRDEPMSLLRAAEALRRETLELGKAIESWALPQRGGTSKSSTSPVASPQQGPSAANDTRRYIEILPSANSASSTAMPQVHGLPLLAQSLPSPVFPYMLAPAVPQPLAPSPLRPLTPLGNRALDVRLPSPMPALAPHLAYSPTVAQGNAALQASACGTWMQNSLGQVELTAQSSPQNSISAPTPISAPAPLVYRTPMVGSWDCVQQLNAVAPRAVSPVPTRGWPIMPERGASPSLTFGSATSTLDFSRPLLEAGEDCIFSRGSI